LQVTKVALRQGQVAAVDVELPDGYVLRRVAIDKIRTAFVVASD
jgi:hypothetical protein